MVISQELADKFFLDDIWNFEEEVNYLLRVPVTQNQFDALVSFAYNVGSDIDTDTLAEGLGDSTLLKYLNAGNLGAAADEFPKWNKAKGKILPGLTRRRKAERELFLAA
jgi:lysozyme